MKKTNTPRTDRKIKSLRQPFDPDVSAIEAQDSFDALAEFARTLEKQNDKLRKRVHNLVWNREMP